MRGALGCTDGCTDGCPLGSTDGVAFGCIADGALVSILGAVLGYRLTRGGVPACPRDDRWPCDDEDH